MNSKPIIKIIAYFVIRTTESIQYTIKPINAKPYTFLDLRFDNRNMPIGIFFDHNLNYYYDKIRGVYAGGDEFTSFTDDEVKYIISKDKIIIDYSHTRVPTGGLYTFSTKELLELMNKYIELKSSFDQAQGVGKSWHGIPTDPEYFKENNIGAMYYQPETGKIGVYDLKNGKAVS